MKKVFAMVFAVVASASFAAMQYSAGIFTTTTGGDVNITYYSPASKYGQVTDFGYYTLDAEGNLDHKISLDTALKGNETVTITGLKENQSFGLYFDTKKNTMGTIYTEGKLNKEEADIFYFKRDKDDYWTFGDTKWGDGQVVAFKMDVAGQDITDDPIPDPVTGQPLPGIVVTAALCLGVFAAKKRFGKAGK